MGNTPLLDTVCVLYKPKLKKKKEKHTMSIYHLQEPPGNNEVTASFTAVHVLAKYDWISTVALNLERCENASAHASTLASHTHPHP